jgi:hypothetical protein
MLDGLLHQSNDSYAYYHMKQLTQVAAKIIVFDWFKMSHF